MASVDENIISRLAQHYILMKWYWTEHSIKKHEEKDEIVKHKNRWKSNSQVYSLKFIHTLPSFFQYWIKHKRSVAYFRLHYDK